MTRATAAARHQLSGVDAEPLQGVTQVRGAVGKSAVADDQIRGAGDADPLAFRDLHAGLGAPGRVSVVSSGTREGY